MESIKVLIVEDSFIAARVLKQLIDKHEGVVCSIVSSGKEAIERVKSECFSVILMDISLGGGLDGAITTREIRKLEPKLAYPRALIYAVTGHVTDKDNFYYESMGIDRVFEKPLNDDQLEWILSQAIPTAAPKIAAENVVAIDYAKIANAYYGGDETMAHEIATEFQQELNTALNTMKKHHAENQPKLVADSALNLANDASYLFLEDIASVCRQLVRYFKEEKKISKPIYEKVVSTCRKYATTQ